MISDSETSIPLPWNSAIPVCEWKHNKSSLKLEVHLNQLIANLKSTGSSRHGDVYIPRVDPNAEI